MKEVLLLSLFIYGVSIVYCIMNIIRLSDKYRALENKYIELKSNSNKKPKHMKLYEDDTNGN